MKFFLHILSSAKDAALNNQGCMVAIAALAFALLFLAVVFLR